MSLFETCLRRVIGPILRIGFNTVYWSWLCISAISRPMFLSVILLVVMQYAFWVVLKAMLMTGPETITLFQDSCFVILLILITLYCLYLSLWGTADLRQWLEDKGFAAKASRPFWWGVMLPTAMAAYLILSGQAMLREVNQLLEHPPAGAPHLMSLDVLKFALSAWALLVAYKFKVVWDMAVHAVGKRSSRAVP